MIFDELDLHVSFQDNDLSGRSAHSAQGKVLQAGYQAEGTFLWLQRDCGNLRRESSFSVLEMDDFLDSD